MAQFLIAIHRPADYDPAVAEDVAMREAIAALNRDMVAAGVRVFVGGLHPIQSARSLQRRSEGTVVLGEGPYLKTPEHVGGFWVLEVASMEAALAWGRKAADVCRASVEVRQFH